MFNINDYHHYHSLHLFLKFIEKKKFFFHVIAGTNIVHVSSQVQ